MLLVMEEVRAFEVLVPLYIASVDRADVDCGVDLAESGVGSIFGQRATNANEATFHVRDHHMLDLELCTGVGRINLPGNDGVCCGRHCSPSSASF